MGSTEEAQKPITLYDSSSSPTHPLLSKAPFPSSPPPLDDPPAEPDSDPTQYLQISYNYGPRPLQDLPFLLLFALFVLLTFSFGIFSIFHRNTYYSSLSSFSYDSNSTSCVEDSLSELSPTNWVRFYYVYSSSILDSVIWTLVVTFILSIPICLLLLLLLRHYTKQIVYASLPFFIIIPIFFNVYWFVACTVSSSCSDAFPLVYRILVLVFAFLVIGLVIWILVVNWNRIELTIMIIGVASDALSRNLGLFGVLPCLTLGLVVYYAPIVVFLVYARQNGNIVVKETDGEYTCAWKQDGWVPAYYALAILTMLWSAAAMVEAQVFVIGGAIAQWYFSKENETPKRSLRSSLRLITIAIVYFLQV